MYICICMYKAGISHLFQGHCWTICAILRSCLARVNMERQVLKFGFLLFLTLTTENYGGKHFYTLYERNVSFFIFNVYVIREVNKNSIFGNVLFMVLRNYFFGGKTLSVSFSVFFFCIKTLSVFFFKSLFSFNFFSNFKF